MRNFVLTALLAVVGALSAFAQAGGVAGLSGTVRDSSQGVVANAKVVISSASQGEIRSIQTNDAGVFAAPALTPGAGYEVKITAQGFAPYDLKNITLQVGQNLDLHVDLQVAQSTTEVDVSAAAELVDDAKVDVSQGVSQQQISELPVNGRRVDSFVLLTPGVTNDATFGLLSFRGVAGNNSFLLDGNDNTEQFYDENAGRTRIQSQVSQDAVQEFQVVSENFSAEFGRAMGGVVNTVTKSGTNEIHGSGFYYFRSTSFDARDPFASFNPSEKRVEGGGVVGGPIIKNKLFYLVTADLTYRYFPMVDSYVSAGIVNPTNQTWVGCGAPATPAQCNAINALLPRFFGQIPRTDDNDLAFGKIDYRPNDHHSFVGEFNFLRWWSPNGIQTGLTSTSGAGITGNGDDSVRVRNGKFGYTWVPSSNIVNVFRFGWDTDRQADSFDQAELGSGLGYLDVSVAGVQLGPATYLPRVEPSETRHEYADDLTWTKGNHTLKFGFNAASTRDYNYYISNAFGSYTYNTVTAFAQDYTGNTTGAKNWASYSQTFGNPVADYTIKEYSWYAQDQWKVTPKFTATLGIRWDKSSVPKFPVVNPDYPQTGSIHTPATNFAPRIGLAYRLNDKTVIRTGYGIFYARMLGGLIDNLWTTNGIYQIADSFSATNATQLAVGPVFPNSLAAAPTGAGVGAATLQFAAPNLKTPYTQQANLSIQRQIRSDMVLTVSGIWSRGINLLGATDLNAAATTSYTYTIQDANGNNTGSFTLPIYTSPRPSTKYGAIYEVTNGVNSWYEALAVTLEKKYSHGFQWLASYTWAHEIDENQGGGSNAIFYSSTSNLFNGNYAADKGSGSLDQRHRLVYSAIYAPTFLKSGSPAARFLVNNWSLSGIITMASGRPASSPTVRVVSAPTLASGAFLSTSTLDGFSGSTRVPFLPINSLYTPPVYRADLRLTKLIPLRPDNDKLNLTLNFEVFNLTNSWAATSLASQEYTATKGVLQATPTAWGYATADGGFPDGTQARRMQISARIRF